MQTRELIKQFDAAFEMRKAGDYAGALRAFQNLEESSRHPRDVAALRLFQTMCLTDLGRIDEADQKIRLVDEKMLDAVDRVDYESEYARIKRAEGMTNLALERIDRALQVSESVEDKCRVEVATGSLQALRGVLLAESGRCDEAVPILEEIPAENPWWTEARIYLGDCKIKKRRYQEAIETYSSIASGSGQPDPIHRKTALRNIGCAYYYMGEYAKAIEYLTKVEHGYDGNPDLKADLFRFLASAYSHLGMTKEAAKYGGFSKSTTAVQ
jgi:tetratricopeptide (TPR) repeat protein